MFEKQKCQSKLNPGIYLNSLNYKKSEDIKDFMALHKLRRVAGPRLDDPDPV